MTLEDQIILWLFMGMVNLLVIGVIVCAIGAGIWLCSLSVNAYRDPFKCWDDYPPMVLYGCVGALALVFGICVLRYYLERLFG